MSERRRHLEMAAMYARVVRKPVEGTAGAAVKVHAQACGFVAYAFDVHPDEVARAVSEYDSIINTQGE